MTQCTICGGTQFTRRPILWDRLIEEWELSVEEVDYINRQQGKMCDSCGANLRSIALAHAIRSHLGTDCFFNRVPESEAARNVRILEVNEAGTLSSILRRFSGYVFAAYPEVDMRAMPFESDSFDLVVHSDTLEHIERPIEALAECRRVLKTEGALCFTVPVIVGRASRSRAGLPASYHGDASMLAGDWMVQTEFGADVWTYVMQAGFTDVTILTIEYPAGIALSARKRPPQN